MLVTLVRDDGSALVINPLRVRALVRDRERDDVTWLAWGRGDDKVAKVRGEIRDVCLRLIG